MPKRSLKSLVKHVHIHAEDAPHALSVKIGGSTFVLSGNGTYLGTLAGENYAALIIGEKLTLILERDHKATAKTYKIIEPTEDQFDAITKDLLPEPEPPAEVVAANAALAQLPKLPRGWAYALDGKGNLTVVESTSGGDPEAAPRTRAPRGTAVPREKKPEVVKGMTLTRSKDGHQYKVTGVDKNLKKAFLEPAKKGEGETGLAQTYPAPVFWKNWSLLVA